MLFSAKLAVEEGDNFSVVLWKMSILLEDKISWVNITLLGQGA